MKIIVTKTWEQYVRCCHQNCWRVGVVPWINSVEAVHKIDRPVEPVFFGDFWNLPGYDLMERAMKSKGIKVNGQYVKRN